MIRMTTTTRLILDVFLDVSPDDPLWGYRICQETNLGPGTVYPILDRLESHGWIVSEWETASAPDRPRRRLYTISSTGRLEYAAKRHPKEKWAIRPDSTRRSHGRML